VPVVVVPVVVGYLARLPRYRSQEWYALFERIGKGCNSLSRIR